MKKIKPASKTVFARPTEPMRRTPKSKWDEAIDPLNTALDKINADGWLRLCEILNEAKQDKAIAACVGASDFLEVICGLSENPTNAESSIQPFMPLAKILAGSLLKDNKGRHKGGETTKAKHDAHQKEIKKILVPLFSDPACTGYKPSGFVGVLMSKGAHKYNGIEIGEKAMLAHFHEILTEYKASKSTS